MCDLDLIDNTETITLGIVPLIGLRCILESYLFYIFMQKGLGILGILVISINQDYAAQRNKHLGIP